MYGDIHIALASKTGISIPVEAAVDTGERQYVFVARPGGRFEPRPVKLGARTNGSVEVLEGLVEGETVVTAANFLLDSESRLRAAIEGTASGAPAATECDREVDQAKYPDKYAACRACEIQHQGMGDMVTSCKNAIPKPWR
jgi:Cu(I)/Ag(I) efflux system membrane fusion protein